MIRCGLCGGCVFHRFEILKHDMMLPPYLAGRRQEPC